MTIALGIDTGGTYTDAVLVDHSSGQVLAGAKALTSYHDLSIGIGQAVSSVLGEHPSIAPTDIGLVSISTTLATNAIVEGKGCSVCLLLIGYDPGLIRQYGFERDLVTQDVVYLRGGHDGAGDEVEPLDEAAAREAILARRGRVQAFAVSGYFGVRNPAHEARVRALAHELMPEALVTCGHELTVQLNSVRRATTAALNARLIPLLRDLTATVRATLDRLGIAAPLMIVKGDGSLVRADWAMQRPVETILSGPAASVVGAWHLAGRRDVWTVDVGGTTTDIAALRDGRPRLNPEGAHVGVWRTMVQAVDVHTLGLGGDSHVRVDEQGRLSIGPRRVMPLCLLASEYPEILSGLEQQVGARRVDSLAGQFVLRLQRPVTSIADEDVALLETLARGPQALSTLADKMHYGAWVSHQVERLELQRLVLRAGFTPTDALHVLGRFVQWNADASRFGAAILSRATGLAVEDLCERVVAGVSDRVTQALATKVLSDEAVVPNAAVLDWESERVASALLARALGNVNGTDLGCGLTLNKPLVAIGAPVQAYLPRTARQLNTELVIPAHADVANAVGAVAGSVVQRLQAMLRPLSDDHHVRLHLPEVVLDFPSIEEGVAHAEQVMLPEIRALAHRAGAGEIEVHTLREDHYAPTKGGWDDQVYLGTELTFTAVGRPSLAA